MQIWVAFAFASVLVLGPADAQTAAPSPRDNTRQHGSPQVTDVESLLKFSEEKRKNVFRTTSRPQFFIDKFRPKVSGIKTKPHGSRRSSLSTEVSREDQILDEIRFKIEQATAQRTTTKPPLIFTRFTKTDDKQNTPARVDLNTKEGGLEGTSFTIQEKIAPSKGAEITGFRSRAEEVCI